jgi:transcriptional regulator with XRE-family HTH domain
MRSVDNDNLLPYFLLHLALMGNKTAFSLAKPRRRRGRVSLKKTPLAVLRHLVGEHVSDFARTIGLSVNYLWKLESAQKPLGEEVALRVQKATGVDAAWLLGDAIRHPVDDMGDPYTFATYERRRAALAGEGGSMPKQGSVPGFLGARVDAILVGAASTHDERIFRYRLAQFLANAKADFGSDERVQRDGETAALALQSLRDIFRERLHPKTGKPITGKYVVPEYQEARDAFRKELTKLRKKAYQPIALGMPASGPGILPVLEVVAVLVGIETPWWLKGDHDEDAA